MMNSIMGLVKGYEKNGSRRNSFSKTKSVTFRQEDSIAVQDEERRSNHKEIKEPPASILVTGKRSSSAQSDARSS